MGEHIVSLPAGSTVELQIARQALSNRVKVAHRAQALPTHIPGKAFAVLAPGVLPQPLGGPCSYSFPLTKVPRVVHASKMVLHAVHTVKLQVTL